MPDKKNNSNKFGQSLQENYKLYGRNYSRENLIQLYRQVANDSENRNKSFLGSVKIKTTRKCNLDCKFCSRGKKDLINQKKPETLTTKDFKRIFSDVLELGAKKIHLTGGEFFLRKDYEQILQYATSSKLNITITTNGTLLNEKKIQDLKKFRITSIQISLDSFSPDYHDQIRGVKGAFDKSVNSISLIKNFLPKVNVNVNMVGTRYLYQSGKEAVCLLKKIKPQNLLIIPLKNSPEEANLFPELEDLKDFNESIIPQIKSVYKDEKKAGLSLTPYAIQNNEIKINLDPLNSGVSFYKENTCFAAWTHTYIHDNGRVSVCCHRPDDFFAGNIKKEGLSTIFFNPEYDKARKILIKKSFKRCLDCEMFIKENHFLNKDRSRFLAI